MRRYNGRLISDKETTPPPRSGIGATDGVEFLELHEQLAVLQQRIVKILSVSDRQQSTAKISVPDGAPDALLA
jgi:hypothetical protein